MVCTHTLYNEVWAGSLDLSVTELPEAMKRKRHKASKPREHKKNFGTERSVRSRAGAVQSTLRIPTPHGNVPKTNATTGCFEPSFRRACPLRLSLLSTPVHQANTAHRTAQNHRKDRLG